MFKIGVKKKLTGKVIFEKKIEKVRETVLWIFEEKAVHK